MLLAAAPGNDEINILLNELPNVVPYPRSSGSTTKRPNLLSDDSSMI